MNSVWKFALLGLLATTRASAEDPTGQVVDYVTSLIRYLSEQEPVTFDCWFYETPEQPSAGSTLDAIVTSDRLSLIPRRILHSEGKVDVHRSPGVLVLIVNGVSRFMEMILFLNSHFDRGIKIVVLYNNDNSFVSSVEMLRYMQLHDFFFCSKHSERR